jgi:hypothetical protein
MSIPSVKVYPVGMVPALFLVYIVAPAFVVSGEETLFKWHFPSDGYITKLLHNGWPLHAFAQSCGVPIWPLHKSFKFGVTSIPLVKVYPTGTLPLAAGDDETLPLAAGDDETLPLAAGDDETLPLA